LLYKGRKKDGAVRHVDVAKNECGKGKGGVTTGSRGVQRRVSFRRGRTSVRLSQEKKRITNIPKYQRITKGGGRKADPDQGLQKRVERGGNIGRGLTQRSVKIIERKKKIAQPWRGLLKKGIVEYRQGKKLGGG